MIRPLLLLFLLNGLTLNAQLYFTTGAGFTVDHTYNTVSYVEVRGDGTYFSGNTGQTLSGYWTLPVDATGVLSSLYLYGLMTTAPSSSFSITLYDSSFNGATLGGSWFDLASGYADLNGNLNNINLSDIFAIDIALGVGIGNEPIDGMISRLGGGLSYGPYPPSIDLEDEYLLIQNKLFTLNVADSITSDSSHTLSYQWFHPSGNSYPDDLGGNSSTLNLYGAESNSGAWTLEVSDEWGSSTHTLNLIYKQDSDGDGLHDGIDAFPDDPAETTDSDGDGVGDNADAFPNDPAETTDSDGDGVGDNADAFPNDPAETTDSDGDGVGDNADAFPNDPAETTDSDGDGVGDNADAFPNDPAETTDSDGDGVGDNADAFPNDPAETTDSDGDGVGDNADAFPNYSDSVIFNFISDYISSNNYMRLNEIQDLRPGSTMIEVSGNQATVQLQMEESSDLQTWEDTGTPATMTIPADTDTKFFRFKMAE